MKIERAVVAILGVGVLASAAVADDWAQWRGQKRDGISQEKDLLKEWTASSPKLAWQLKDIGFGYSTPSVVGDRIYLMSNEGNDSEFVRAYSVKDGKPIWSTKVGKVGNPDQQPSYPGARSTPTVDGKMLYALGSDGDFVCLNTANGKPLWKKSLRTDFGGKPGVWAYSESPLVDGDKVIVAPGGETATVVALDKKNGNTIWKSAIPGEKTASYASAIVMEVGGTRQYVQYLSNGLTGLDAKTGKMLWRYDKSVDKQYRMHAATPVAFDDLVYSAAQQGGGIARIKATADSYQAEMVYNERKVPNGLGGTVKVGDYLYGTTNGSQLMCLEYATGRVVWEQRVPSVAALAYADGNLYLHGDNSDMALVEATPTGFKEKGRFTLPSLPERGQPKAWAYPVIANGRLYLREQNCLWAYDIQAGQ